MNFSPLVVVMALAPYLVSQPANYQSFGPVCGQYKAQLVATGTPSLGSTFRVTMIYGWHPLSGTSAITRWNAAMVTGLSNKVWSGGTLPVPLPTGCPLLVAPQVIETRSVLSPGGYPPIVSRVPPYRSGIEFQYTVPNDNALIGLEVYQQMFVGMGSPAMPIYFVGSRGGIATVGN